MSTLVPRNPFVHISSDEEQELVLFINKIVFYDQLIEQQKLMLKNRHDVDYQELFKTIQKYQPERFLQAITSISAVISFLKVNGTESDEGETYIFKKIFNIPNSQMILNYNDFLGVVKIEQSQDYKNYQNQTQNRNSFQNQNRSITSESTTDVASKYGISNSCQKLLYQILQLQLVFYREVDALNDNFNEQYNKDLYKLTIQSLNFRNPSISYMDLKMLIAKNGASFSEDNYNSLLRKLKFYIGDTREMYNSTMATSKIIHTKPDLLPITSRVQPRNDNKIRTPDKFIEQSKILVNETQIFTPTRDYSRHTVIHTQTTKEGLETQKFLNQIENSLLNQGHSPMVHRRTASLPRSQLSLRKPIFEEVVDYVENSQSEKKYIHYDSDFLQTINFQKKQTEKFELNRNQNYFQDVPIPLYIQNISSNQSQREWDRYSTINQATAEETIFLTNSQINSNSAISCNGKQYKPVLMKKPENNFYKGSQPKTEREMINTNQPEIEKQYSPGHGQHLITNHQSMFEDFSPISRGYPTPNYQYREQRHIYDQDQQRLPNKGKNGFQFLFE